MALEFKVYVSGGREHFEWSDPLTGKENKRDFELSQSLLDLIDVDKNSDVLYDNQYEVAELVKLFRYREAAPDTTILREYLDRVAGQHVYLEFFRADWLDRIQRFENGLIPDPSNEMYFKGIMHLPANLGYWSTFVREIIAAALDVFSPDAPIQEKVAAYCNAMHDIIFHFEPITTSFERVGDKAYAEVLRPKSIREIVEFLMRAIVVREITFKTCRACGRYFPNTVHGNSEYCERLFKDTGRTCKEIGSVKMYQARVEEKPEYKIYQRAYKTHFARIKARRLTKEQFAEWAKEARRQRDLVSNGKLPLDNFEFWVRNT